MNVHSIIGEELELLARGSPEAMNIEELKNSAIYEGFALEGSDPTVQTFWRIFTSFNLLDQRSLLSFITGSSLIPCTGALVLKIVNAGEGGFRFMTSRTCFNQLN